MALHFVDTRVAFHGQRARATLREIDALVRDEDARGVLVLRGSRSALGAFGRHLERRARSIGRRVVSVDGGVTDDAFRELAARILPEALGLDAMAAARSVLARARGGLLLIREGATTSFGLAFAAELVRAAADGDPSMARAFVIVLATSAPSTGEEGVRVLDVEDRLSNEDREVWWEAVARDEARASSRAGAVERVDTLESWWAAARATPVLRTSPPPSLSAEALRLATRLALAQRSWPRADLHVFGAREATDELVQLGLLVADAEATVVVLAEGAPGASEATAADRSVVAAALDALPDPWAAARASELHESVGAFAAAERSALRAIASAADPSARADFWARWERLLLAATDAATDDEAFDRLVRLVDVAVRTGDVERAISFGGHALGRRPHAFGALLALGRANVARGDGPTATHWLAKALNAARTPEERAMVDAQLAEVRHMDGDMDGAERHARSAAELAGDVATRLAARNILGKILLARRAWAEAEAHFAAEACEAAVAGDLTAELRARLNRAIALMSSGRIDDARSHLAAVLDDGEARGEIRAVAYALTNLASIATLKRDYMEALRLSERAFEVRRRVGDKLTLALLITNMAELKLQLGMVAEAEQALAFGLRACGPGMPGSRASHFAITAAQVHFARGRTLEARAELASALASAGRSPHGARPIECFRLGARIALEEGDVVSARRAIDQLADAAESPRDRAWAALLEAGYARAVGEAYGFLGEHALRAAREADDAELCREAHVLLRHAAVLDGDAPRARRHIELAVALRDRIADGLPAEMRGRFLARRDLAELAALAEAITRGAPSADAPHPHAALGPRASRGAGAVPNVPESGRGEQRASRRGDPAPALARMVGRTPAMLALASAVAKVGRSDATVLVHGESGTGKELVAEAIHESSPRRSGPIIKVNCAALVETLLLSELFGHEKGSFTGAAARRRGRFELADGGTLFLDEIGDISARTQVALLRVLQDRTFERVGGTTALRADVRIVCATHRDLPAMVQRGEFREDLYYRLRGVVLEVPPLRDRLDDLPFMADAILERLAAERGAVPKRIAPAALDALARHTWPGNVRELDNALRAAALFAEGPVIQLHDLTSNVGGLSQLASAGATSARSANVAISDRANAEGECVGPATLDSRGQQARGSVGTDDAFDDCAMSHSSKIAQFTSGTGGSALEVAYAAIRAGISLSDLKRDIERDCIARALAETGGNITRAAGLLGMKRPRLSQLVKQYGLGSASSGAEAEGEAEEVE